MSRRKKVILGVIILIVLVIVGVVILNFLRSSLISAGRSSYDYDTYSPPTSSSRSYSGVQSDFGEALGLSAETAALAPSGFSSRKQAAAPPPSPSAVAKQELSANRLIVKSGYMSLVAQDVSQTVQSVENLIAQAKGFVVESSIQDQTTIPNARMKVRVPAAGFESFIEQVRPLATRVVSESVTGEDVTEEYVDVQAQLRNLRASEAQFLKIMERAGTIQDVLAVQRELERLRNDIERAEGRKKYLEQSAAMSTLQLYIAAEEEALPTITPQQKWRPKAVFKSAVRGLILTVQGLANLIIRLAVLAPIWLPILIIAYVFWRRHKKHNPS